MNEMKTPEQILDEVAAENMINIQQMVTTKQLAITAIRRYARIYHQSKVKKLGISDVIGSTETDEWEVLLNGDCFTNGLRAEKDCLAEIEYGKSNGHEGVWSYREIVKTYNIGKSVTL